MAPTRKALEEKVGRLQPSRVGAIVKELVDRLKVRLIHDLSRGGVHQQVNISERVILPRLSDLSKDLLELAGEANHLEDLEIFIIDFKDAFKQLHVAPEE